MPEDLRSALARLADGARMPARPDPSVLAKARRRLVGTLVSSTLLVCLTVGGGVLGIRELLPASDHRPVVGPSLTTSATPDVTSSASPGLTSSAPPVPTSSSSRSPEPSSTAEAGLPDHGMLFRDGLLIRLVGGDQEIVARLPEERTFVPPVLTQDGVVVLTGHSSVDAQLSLVSDDGRVQEIDHGVTAGFAVDPARHLVAYATTVQSDAPPHYATTVHVRSLADGSEVAISRTLDFFAAVAGIADGRVVLSTGDGGSAAAAVWDLADQSVRRFFTYGAATGTDPVTGTSVLTEGDGPIPILVRFREAPAGQAGLVPSEVVIDRSVLQLEGIDFLPPPEGGPGGVVAGTQPTRAGSELVIVDEPTGAAARIAVPRRTISQAVWVDADTVVVLDKYGREAIVGTCDLTSGRCVFSDRPLGASGRFGDEEWWLVRGSF
jgi:hypothetical protein